MSWTTSAAATTSARCSATTKTPRWRSPAVGTQTAPFSATAKAPGRTARPIPSRACGSGRSSRRTSPSTPGTAEATRAAPTRAARARTSSPRAAGPATRTSAPPTAATASASFARGSGKRTPSPERSGAGRSGAQAARSAASTASRLPSAMLPPARPAPRLAEALGGRLGQLAPPPPGVPAPVEERAREGPQGPAGDPAGELVRPAAAEDPRHGAQREPLREEDDAAPGEVLAEHEELLVDVDLDRAEVVARAAQR